MGEGLPAEVRRAFEPRMTKYIPWTPTVKQAVFLSPVANLVPEVLFGGSAGGGKSVSLLAAALQYVDVPGYNALLLRKTFPELSQPGGLMDLAEQWLTKTDASWNGETKTWTFPSRATLSFGYLEQERQKFRYAGSAFAFVGFDELTAFPEGAYRFLFSRLRKTTESAIPLRMRATSNPGNVGHEWVKRRFLDSQSDRRAFIPSRLSDNPHLDYESYVASLSELDPVTRRQLLEGDWTAREAGGMLRREWFEVIDQAPRHLLRVVRYVDLAATGKTDRNDPDWTAGAKLAKDLKGDFYLLHMFRYRGNVGETETALKHLAAVDGVEVPWFVEQEPGASGKIAMDHLQRTVLAGHAVTPVKASGTRGATNAVLGAKVVRAGPMASAAQAGRVKVVRGPWNEEFLDEADAFPRGGHDDMVDALSGAFAQLHRRGSVDGIADLNRGLGVNSMAAELYGLAVDEDLRRGLA